MSTTISTENMSKLQQQQETHTSTTCRTQFTYCKTLHI